MNGVAHESLGETKDELLDLLDAATRIRWGSIHEFKGLEAPAVILTDVDMSKGYHRDLLYVGASRATDRLVVLEADRAAS